MKQSVKNKKNRIVIVVILCIAVVGTVTIFSNVKIQGDITGESEIIVDERDPAPLFTKSGAWGLMSSKTVYKQMCILSKQPSATASWTINVIPRRTYAIQTSWLVLPINRKKVTYSVRDAVSNAPISSVTVDQTKPPASEKTNDGVLWETIAKVTAQSDKLIVTVQTTDSGKPQDIGLLVADAVRAKDVTQNICGDGVSEGSEECDDGNTVANDGCTQCQRDFCTDTDETEAFPGGLNNSFVRGTLKGTGGGGGIFTDSDRCLDTTTLLEYGCIGTQTNATNITCDNGCSNGACIQSSASSHSNSSSSYSSECWDPQHCSSGSSSSGRRSF